MNTLHPAPVRNLLVLGCGGFIGSHLLDRLLDPAGGALGSVHVTGWDLGATKIARHLEHPRFRFVRSSINDPAQLPLLRTQIADADVVLNLAAICNPSQYNTEPLATIQANFLDGLPLVEACTDAGAWLIHFSTSEVYGRTIDSYLPGHRYADPNLYELDEDATPLVMGPIVNQRWSYACAKQLMERWIYAHHRERGLRFSVVRPLNFFGPRMDFIPGRDGEGVPRVLACFMTALLDRQPMRLVDGGQARRTILSIHDGVEAVIAMLRHPRQAQGHAFNIGNRDNEVTIAQLAELMRSTYAQVSGDASYLDHPIVSVPGREFYGEGYEDCDRRMPKVDKARTLLQWTPRIPLAEAVRETVAYYHDLYGRTGSPTPAHGNGNGNGNGHGISVVASRPLDAAAAPAPATKGAL